jgi:hypothetical protein
MRSIAFLLLALTAWTGAGRAAEHRQLPGPVLERRLEYVAFTAAKIASRARAPESSTVSHAAAHTAPSCAFTRS